MSSAEVYARQSHLGRARARAFVLGAAFTLTIASVCHAARLRVLVTHERMDAAARRLLAEVRNIGFEPVDVERAETAPVPIPAKPGGIVGILSLRRSGRIDVTVILPDTGKVAYTFTVAPGSGTPAAVRVVEELRGRLTELKLGKEDAQSPAVPESEPGDAVRSEVGLAAEAPEPGGVGTTEGDAVEHATKFEERASALAASSNREVEQGAPPPAPPKDESEPRDSGRELFATREARWNVWIGGGVGTESGMGGAMMTAAKLEARVAPWKNWSASLFGVLPFESQNISGPEGAADVRVQLFGGLLKFKPLELHDWLFADVGLGMGAAVITMNGHSSAPSLRGQTTSVVPATALASVGLGVRARRWLALRADAIGGAAFDRGAVRFEGRDAAVWGPLSLAVTAGVELDLLALAR